MLNGLSKAGFNAIRLPMWPESSEVWGPDPTAGSDKRMPWNFCDWLSKNVIKALKNHNENGKDFDGN